MAVICSGFLQVDAVDRIVSGHERALDPGTATVIRITGAVNTPKLSGLKGGVDGRVVLVQNVSGVSYTVVSANAAEASATAAANRILANITTAFSGSGMLLWYDGARLVWVVLAK